MNPRMWQCHAAGSFKLPLSTQGLAVSLGANKKFHSKARAWILDVSSYGVVDVEIIAAGERESFGCVPWLAVVGRISGEGRKERRKERSNRGNAHCDRLFASWSSSIPKSDTAIDTYGPQTCRFLARCPHFSPRCFITFREWSAVSLPSTDRRISISSYSHDFISRAQTAAVIYVEITKTFNKVRANWKIPNCRSLRRSCISCR